MSRTPSLFQVNEDFIVDLDKIAYIKGRWIRFLGADGATEQNSIDADKIRTAWIAYKGKFDPSKER